jgi:uncharacterized protein YecE (DUF72 family)
VAQPQCPYRIGTSGWHYDDWSGRFYPDDLPKKKWFGFYSQHFDTVEVNNTFYHLPKEKTFQSWHDQAPPNFRFTLKASRYITHIKKLNDPADSVALFFERAELLKSYLGPVLYQLPPSQHKDLEKLAAFLKCIPTRHLPVFEFRHQSWYDDDVLELLDSKRAAFCVHDMGELTTPRAVTGRAIYIRFHGTSGRYSGNYTDKMLADWADWIRDNTANVKAVYAYFNNDIHAFAVNNAKTLRSFLIEA